MLKRTRDLMNENVRDSLVEGFEHHIPAIDIPDEDDKHVVAAAIQSNADLIVTFNLKDFPQVKSDAFNISVLHPDDFIFDLLDLPPCPCAP